MKNEVESSDIYKSAYLLLTGGKLNEVRVSRKQRIEFVILGENLWQNEVGYRTGHALVNPLAYKDCIHYLRDLISEKLDERKNNEKRSRRKKK